jgi:uncharacterized SAM-binding protein YcdF (DUF218 family)
MRLVRLVQTLTLASLGLLVLAFCAGFVWFALSVPRSSDRPVMVDVDAVVVLTGGSNRVEEALKLFAAGNGRRLLISGVNPTTQRMDILRLQGEPPPRLTCCVDLGRTAQDTIGNAEETASWVRSNSFASLIVVTSGYHMPRAIAEIRHLLPETRLIPYPVASAHLAAEDPFGDLATFQIVAGEYVKHVVGVIRRLAASRP